MVFGIKKVVSRVHTQINEKLEKLTLKNVANLPPEEFLGTLNGPRSRP